MRNWLIDNAFLAAWLSPLIALVGICIQNSVPSLPKVDWSRVVLYMIILTALAVAFTPKMDSSATAFGRYVVGIGMVWIYWDLPRREG